MIEKVDLGFTVEKSLDGSETYFETHGAGLSLYAWLSYVFFIFIFSVPLLISAVVLMNSDKNTRADLETASAIVSNYTLIYLLLAFSSSIFVFLRNKSRKRKYNFAITTNSIRSNGKEYAKTDITEIFIRNKYDQATSSVNVTGGTVAVGTGIAGAGMVAAAALSNASAAAGAATTASMAKRSFDVCLRHGRKIVPLAQNMLEDDALCLYRNIIVLI